MPVEIKVPPVGESITEVIIGTWLKSEGEQVAEDEPLVVVESDKANLEVPAPAAGVLTRIIKVAGKPAGIGEVVGEIEPGAVAAAPERPAAEAPAGAPPPAPGRAEPRVTPTARRALAEHGLSAGQVEATGPAGRLVKDDVLRHVEGRPQPAGLPAPAPAAPDGRQEEVVPMSPLRRTVARRLVEAQQTAALLTTFNEVDMTEVMALRQIHRDSFQSRHGIKLGFMSFFVKAVIEGLKAFPALNAEIRDDQIVYHNYFDIGVAVGGGKGLVVPVIRNAERLSFAELEKTIVDFAERARGNKLKLDELKGGTFSITNGGVYGSMLSTPIVNPPQSGILGMHAIKDRPMVVDGQVVVRPVMYVALTYDHRIVDGREAVSFLVRIKDCLESPVRMLLEV